MTDDHADGPRKRGTEGRRPDIEATGQGIPSAWDVEKGHSHRDRPLIAGSRGLGAEGRDWGSGGRGWGQPTGTSLRSGATPAMLMLAEMCDYPGSNQTFILSHSWRLQVQGPGEGGVALSGGLCPWCPGATVSPCPLESFL